MATSGPSPRRIHLDATGWALLRAAADRVGLPTESLPRTLARAEREAETHDLLVATDLLAEDGAPTATTHAALAVLTTAPIVVAVERVEADRATRAVWRTAGTPTAGVVVRDRLEGAAADRDVEVQLLAVDDLLDLVLHELVIDDAAPSSGASGAPADGLEPSEVDADDPAALPPGMLEDGQLVARAAVRVDGPAGTTVAQLLGDGGSWWQVGSTAAGRLRLEPVSPTALRAALLEVVAAQLRASVPSAATAAPAPHGDGSDG